ncbi:MAG: hydrogenase expression/formation protein [Rhodocyclales bacterium GWA2_65_20]|nr:MAG: hydrogenase expression/formation protein [Rhodocyclales bacterium GWA2_65_20]
MKKTVVLGIGNVLWGDEGFGPQAVARLKERNAVPAQIELVDGGTQGLYLLPLIQDAARLVVFDAVDFGKPPGAIVVLRDAEIPAYFGQRPLSLHQTAFTDVLAAAALTGALPEAITLIGVQFENIDAWGGGLSPAVAAAIDRAIEIGLGELESWEEATYA